MELSATVRDFLVWAVVQGRLNLHKCSGAESIENNKCISTEEAFNSFYDKVEPDNEINAALEVISRACVPVPSEVELLIRTVLDFDRVHKTERVIELTNTLGDEILSLAPNQIVSCVVALLHAARKAVAE
jgi:hypothetical protein